MPAVTDTLFVYGPWSPGQPLFWKLEEYLIRSEPATVRGSLYRSQLGFPLFVNEGRDRIRGHYLELTREFRDRRTLPVECVVENTLRPTRVIAYLPEQLPTPLRRIPYGDWEMDLKREPDRLSRMRPEERDYLLQLSTSSGRPDPALDRELLRHGLLVAAGANWGLSRLGKAAATYLSEVACPTNH